MKLGNLFSTREALGESSISNDPDKAPLSNFNPDDIPTKALRVMTPVLEEPVKETSQKEAAFPDISIPDSLNLDQLKATNESIELHSDLAGINLDLLQVSLDEVRKDDEISNLGIKSIGAHIRNIESTFPETKAQDIQYLDKVLTSDQPEVVIMTTESLIKAMGSLRPIVVRGLTVASNIYKFLEQKVDVNHIKTNLENSKTLMTRTERVEIDGKPEYNALDHVDVFPKIVKAIQSGYSVEEIPEAINYIVDSKSSLPATAISAIYQGIRKLPLDKTREIDGRDIGALVVFVNQAKEVQVLASKLLGVVATSLGQGQVNDQVLMSSSAAIDQAIGEFREAVTALGSQPTSGGVFPEASNVSAEFITMPGGDKIVLLTNGKVFAPSTAGERAYGFISPSQLPDVIDACVTKLLPAISAIKLQSSAMAQKSNEVAQVATNSLSDKLRMTDAAGTAFQIAFTKFISSLKLSNAMTTTAVECALNVCSATVDIARGTGVIVET